MAIYRKNSFKAYNKHLEMNPYSVKNMILTHKLLRNELTKEEGRFRSDLLQKIKKDKKR